MGAAKSDAIGLSYSDKTMSLENQGQKDSRCYFAKTHQPDLFSWLASSHLFIYMVCLVDILRESKKSLGDEGDKGYLD